MAGYHTAIVWFKNRIKLKYFWICFDLNDVSGIQCQKYRLFENTCFFITKWNLNSAKLILVLSMNLLVNVTISSIIEGIFRNWRHTYFLNYSLVSQNHHHSAFIQSYRHRNKLQQVYIWMNIMLGWCTEHPTRIKCT